MVETRHRTVNQSGLVTFDPPRIEVPKLVTLGALYIAFHEFGHVYCCHPRMNLPIHIEEYQAETYALALFRVHMLPGVRAFLREARAYVREHIAEDIAQNVPISPKVRRWACYPS